MFCASEFVEAWFLAEELRRFSWSYIQIFWSKLKEYIFFGFILLLRAKVRFIFCDLILSLCCNLIELVYCSSRFALDKCIESAIVMDSDDYSIRGIIASLGKNSSNTQILSAQRFSASRRIKWFRTQIKESMSIGWLYLRRCVFTQSSLLGEEFMLALSLKINLSECFVPTQTVMSCKYHAIQKVSNSFSNQAT